jgi:hypothetical protein
MADLVNARPIARYGGQDDIFPPIYGPIGISANLLMYGGGMAATDANGNAVKADAATAQVVVGVTRKNYYNRTTDPSGGAAGAIQGEFLAGVFPMFISTDGGAITNANRWQDLYVVDDQTVSLNPVGAGAINRLPAGYLVTVDTLGGPTNGLAWVQIGEPNPSAAPKHVAINLTLAQIQAQTSGTAFAIWTAPPNFWLQSANITTTQTFAGGGVTSITTSLSGGADAVTSIVGTGANQLTAGVINSTVGTAPYLKRGGQSIKIDIAEIGGTLATLTAGTLQIDLIGIIAQ